MTARPRVSVVIPCFNHQDYLGECLGSLLAQTFRDWEAIVVDDASTTGSVTDLVKQLQAPAITVIRHPQNRGVAAARNTGFAAARADYVLCVDADDKLSPDFLERTLAAADGFDCVFGDLQEFGESHALRKYAVQEPGTLVHSSWLPGSGTLLRKTLWEKAGRYCEAEALRRGNEDWDFWLSVAGQGPFKAQHVDGPLYFYRITGDSMSRSLWFDYHLTTNAMYERHRELLDRHRAGNAFRARGYYQSAATSFRRGRPFRGRALRLSLQGLRLCPLWPAFYRLIGRILLSYVGVGMPQGK